MTTKFDEVKMLQAKDATTLGDVVRAVETLTEAVKANSAGQKAMFSEVMKALKAITDNVRANRPIPGPGR